MGKVIHVLDHGEVELIDFMGSDQSILRAARVSTGSNPSKGEVEDRGLIRYLKRNQHWSPFEQTAFTFRMKMPIFVARQLMRHHWSWNEYSQRYSPAIDECYVPENFRVQGTKNHQGSGADFTAEYNSELRAEALSIQNETFGVYLGLLKSGVAKEQARIVIPVSNYTELYATTNLRNIFVMLGLRLHEHAQQEIRVFAEAIFSLISELPEFKHSVEAFRDDVEVDWLVQETKNALTQEQLAIYVKRKDQIDRLQRDVTKAEGQQEQVLDRLKKEFNVNTVEEADTLLAKLEAELKTADADIAGYLEDIEKLANWDDL